MHVVYRLEALADFAGHFKYIAHEDPRAAAKVAAEIRRAIGRLALFPRSGRKGEVTGDRPGSVAASGKHGWPTVAVN
jgi:plasmid stabilization system protein ParE